MNFVTKLKLQQRVQFLHTPLLMGYVEIKLYSVSTFRYGELLAEYIKENWNLFWMTAIQFSGIAKLVLKSYYSL